jgi:hypothetical protein
VKDIEAWESCTHDQHVVARLAPHLTDATYIVCRKLNFEIKNSFNPALGCGKVYISQRIVRIYIYNCELWDVQSERAGAE